MRASYANFVRFTPKFSSNLRKNWNVLIKVIAERKIDLNFTKKKTPPKTRLLDPVLNRIRLKSFRFGLTHKPKKKRSNATFIL